MALLSSRGNCRKVRPARTIRQAVKPSGDNPVSVVIIRDGRLEDHYTVQPLAADCGIALATLVSERGRGSASGAAG